MMEVSVIIPFKSKIPLLLRCIASVLEDSAVDQIIVVNDASGEDLEGVRQMANFYKSISVLDNNHSPGAQGARNTGIKHASSEWIAFLDSDDIWIPKKNRFQSLSLYTSNKSPSDDWVISPGWKFDIIVGAIKPTKKFSQHHFQYDILKNPSAMFQGLIVRKATLAKIGYLDENCVAYQEWDTIIRLSQICSPKVIPEPAFYWIRGSDVTISSGHERDFNGFLYVYDKHYELMRKSLKKQDLNALKAQLSARALKANNVLTGKKYQLTILGRILVGIFRTTGWRPRGMITFFRFMGRL